MPDLNKAYQWAIQTCNSPVVGYWTNSDNRNQITVNGITYYDCSSFINYALLAGGWSTPSYAPTHNAFTTGTMPAELRRLGWSQVSASGQILPGDIGLSSSHTEMCYQGGVGTAIFMGAHYGRDGNKGSNIPLQYQVSIGNSSGDATYKKGFPQIWRYGAGGATGYGYSIYVISAMAGNFYHESNINPGIWESLSPAAWTDDYHGYGLGQWTNVGGSRRLEDLKTWLDANSYSVTDGNAQCQYIVHENYWLQKPEYPDFSNLESFLKSNSDDLTELTHAWNWCWEGIHDGSWDQRVTDANKCYNYIQDHAQDSSITDWIVGNRYLDEDEMLNNAVMLYRYFSAGGGGGGTPSLPKSKMPLWMKIRYH